MTLTDKSNDNGDDAPVVVSKKAVPHGLVIEEDNDDNEAKEENCVGAAPPATITEEDNAGSSSKEEEENLGARVAKYFDDDLYHGTVEFTKEVEGEKLWHVHYDDGDEEDYNEEELKAAIELFRSEGADKKKKEDLEDTDNEENPKERQSKADRRRRKRRLDRRAASAKDGESDHGGSDSEKQPAKRKKKKKKKMMSESAEARKAQAEERERVRERNQWRRSNKPPGEEKGDDANKEGKEAVVINKVRPESEQAVEIAPELADRLKPHQIDGVRFLWKSLIHSLDASNKEPGRGAILAHNMGLGKSLQIVTFLHTVLLRKSLPFCTAIILGPKNTLYNWRDEFHKWGADDDMDVHLVDPDVQKTIPERLRAIKKWHDGSSKECPSVLLMSYDQYKMLVGGRPKPKQRKELRKRLLDPGPDIAVLDEGHIIANPKTATNNAVMELKTRRRLILTGTPLSNNLLEYHSMVTFVHHTLLSSSTEFRSRFVQPIEAGQFNDATDKEVRTMKRRVHVLNRKLKPVVHRRGYEILTQSLPPKYEYVVSIRLNDIQKKLYQEFLDRRKEGLEEISFFHAWHSLQRIWNHPRGIEIAEEKRSENERRTALKREMDDFIDDASECSWHDRDNDESEDDILSIAEEKPSENGKKRRATRRRGTSDLKHDTPEAKDDGGDGDESEEFSFHESESEGEEEETKEEKVGKHAEEVLSPSSAAPEANRQRAGRPGKEPTPLKDSQEWWQKILGTDWPEDLATESGKFEVLQSILINLRRGDKLAIFSQSLTVLDIIEEWIKHNDGFSKGDGDEVEFCQGIDFLRIDGSTSSEKRQQICNKMNDMEDPARLILVSVKAGALGINLVGVNRVVLFDTSFNPTHDVQAIFRAYRYGQTRPVSIYRLVASGTMEERIYRRQVEKRALFLRVVDEHQIDRHFSQVDVDEMIRLLEDEELEAEEAKRSTIKFKSHSDAPPSDLLFAQVLKEDGGRKLPRYHEQDSLLENKPEEELTEEEKKDAWANFDKEIAEEVSREKDLANQQSAAIAAAHLNGTRPGSAPLYGQQAHLNQQPNPTRPGSAPLYGQQPYYNQQPFQMQQSAIAMAQALLQQQPQQQVPQMPMAPMQILQQQYTQQVFQQQPNMQSTALTGIANYNVIRAFRITSLGPLGLDIQRIDSNGNVDVKGGQFIKIKRASPGLPGALCGLREDDIFLCPGTNLLIHFDFFLATLAKVRPLVIDVARAAPMPITV